MGGEWSRFYSYPDLHDLEVLHARFIEHRFARHAHEYFVVGYVEQGVQAYTYRRVRQVTPAGHVFLVNPGESHTGEAAAAGGCVYRTMYPRAALMEQLAWQRTGRHRQPWFEGAVLYDPALAEALKRLHREVAHGGSQLAIESWLLSALGRLIVGHSTGAGAPRVIRDGRQAVKRAREYLDEYFAADVSLSRLSAVAGLTPFHLARAFEREVGLPPHVYLETVRIARARALLDRGRAIAEVALDVGYADQSHFTHRFKRVVGIPPGQYVRWRRPRVQ